MSGGLRKPTGDQQERQFIDLLLQFQMSGSQPGEGWWSGSQYQQYWEDLKKVEERLQGHGGHPGHPREERVHGSIPLREERKKGGSKREAAYWKAVAAGLQFENSQLQRYRESPSCCSITVSFQLTGKSSGSGKLSQSSLGHDGNQN